MMKFFQRKQRIFRSLQFALRRSAWANVLSYLVILALCSCALPQVSSTNNSEAQQVVSFASMPGRVLGIVVDKDLIVLEVEPQSAAEIAGIQKGDRLESIENMPFAEARESIKYLIADYTDEDKPLQIKIRRDEKEMIVDVKPLPPPVQVEIVDGKPDPKITPVWPPNDYY